MRDLVTGDFQKRAAHGGRSCKPARVLLVEDEPTLLRVFRTVLMTAAHEVTCCDDGAEALRLFRASPHAFDVVVSDVTMPSLNGDRLAVEVLKIRADMPVILMTGYSPVVSPHNADSLGLAAVLEKPVSVVDLLSAIASARAG